MVATRISGTRIAEEVRAEVAAGVDEMRTKHDVVPGLAVILVGDDPASGVYVRNKERAAIEVGMAAEIVRLPGDASEQDVLTTLDRLNEEPRVHAILVQLPLPDHVDENTVIESIDPDKDVDGLHPYNMGLLMAGRPAVVPATAAAVQQLLLRSGFDPAGQHVVILGRSNIVGKPLANLLMQRADGGNATVTLCHTRTRNLSELTRSADIVVSAIGSPRFLTADMVRDGAVVIDVGINPVPAPDRPRGYRVVGDVDYPEVRKKAAAITPVPGGVGPMTIAMLLNSALAAARMSIHPHLRGRGVAA